MDNPPVLGPILEEDIAFLQGLLLQTMPKVVVEYGYLLGVSAKAMLDVLSPDARLTSIDANPLCVPLSDPRFTLLIQDQTSTHGIPSRIDFCFLDASHGLEPNKQTFLTVFSRLSKGGIILVHDTGVWPCNPYTGYSVGEDRGAYYVHHPEELAFINWVSTQMQTANVVNLRTLSAFRHGFTIIQREMHL